jgi:hypothetical protein
MACAAASSTSSPSLAVLPWDRRHTAHTGNEDMGIAREMIDAPGLRGSAPSSMGFRPAISSGCSLELPYGEPGLPQFETERLLARHLGRFGVAVERGVVLAMLPSLPPKLAGTLAARWTGRRPDINRCPGRAPACYMLSPPPPRFPPPCSGLVAASPAAEGK